MNFTSDKVNGQCFGRVLKGDKVLYVTKGYITHRMALADAKCWAAFHGKEETMPTYTLALDPMDSAFGPRPLGRVTRDGKHITTEYATKGEVWEAVQRTFFNEPVTVFEDGKPVATFYWTFGTAEPVPGKNMVRPVKNLKKWGRGGWEPTGVQSVGNGKLGKGREIRTVKI